MRAPEIKNGNFEWRIGAAIWNYIVNMNIWS